MAGKKKGRKVGNDKRSKFIKCQVRKRRKEIAKEKVEEKWEGGTKSQIRCEFIK